MTEGVTAAHGLDVRCLTLRQVASIGEQPAPVLLRRLQEQRRGHVGLQVRSVRLRAAPVLPCQRRQRQLATP